MASRKTEYDFLERPSQDFFCPVSLELLLEPQLTSCCGHHLSIEAATRLQREGRACPMCNGEQWSAVLDKYHRRKVHEVRVHCWHKGNGCEWVGELNGLEKHAASCENRLWKCKYCGVRCEFVEGEGKHWPTCHKFPEPCPNSCEVGNVERCNMEQHRSVCPLEPVPCEMKEFGCGVVFPRKELATHMKESELQHLTAMTMLNLRLTKQLQQDSTERDKKITQLQEDSAERDKKIAKLQEQMSELKKLHCEDIREEFMGLNMRFDEQEVSQLTNYRIDQMETKMTEMITRMEQNVTEKIEKVSSLVKPQDKQPTQQLPTGWSSFQILEPTQQRSGTTSGSATSSGATAWTSLSQKRLSGTETFTFEDYSSLKGSDTNELSEPFYTHYEGYKLRLKISYYPAPNNDIGAKLQLMDGEYDEELDWPVEIKVRLEVLNQIGDHRHVVKGITLEWDLDEVHTEKTIHDYLMKYTTLERESYTAIYMMNDCLKFKIGVTVL